MVKLRQNLNIFIFVGACLGLGVYSLLGDFSGVEYLGDENLENQQVSDDTSTFQSINYYLIKDGKRSLKLDAQELFFFEDNAKLKARAPVGIFYRQDDSIKDPTKKEIHFKSNLSNGEVSSQELHLIDDVEITFGPSKVVASQIDIYHGGELIEGHGGVKTFTKDMKTQDSVAINSKEVMYKPAIHYFEYKDNVTGKISRKRVYEEGINFSSDKLVFQGQEGLLNLLGHVQLNRSNLKASSNKGTIFLENYNKNLKYYALSDDVRLEETIDMKGKPVLRKAFAEKLESVVSDRTIVLTGLPKVFQGRDVIKGNRIIIRENVETVEVDDANTNIILKRNQ